MENSLPTWTRQLQAGEDLPPAEVPQLASMLAAAELPAEDKGDLLRALANKGEKPTEVAAFASAFRELAIDPGLSDLSAEAIDVVGTGGDRSGSYNFSTTTALALAAAGVRVMKHGNRSITSRSGSADFLALLGISLDAPLPHLRESLERFNFCFFFAPRFHPAFKEIMPVRKALAEQGVRTVFNLLGPLINPGRPGHQVTGVFSADWVGPIAEALSSLGLQAGLVIHCRTGVNRGIDELTTTGENLLAPCGATPPALAQIPPLPTLGLAPALPEDIRGGEAGENLSTFHAILENRAPRGIMDSLLLNIASGFLATGRASSWPEGIATARELIASGQFKNWVKDFTTFLQA